MYCPNCDAEQADGNTTCKRCGIVFEKYWEYHLRPDESADKAPAAPGTQHRHSSNARMRTETHTAMRELFLPAVTGANPLHTWAKAALLAALILWGLSLIGSSVASNAAGESFLHLINLPFHEAGHVIFRPFGEFVTSLGGTLGQLLMPLIAMLVLLLQTRDPFGASVALWWLGENFLDIAPYINDARAGVLPLVGGNFGHSSPYGFHDWEYLLTETGLLHLDHSLALASHLLGSLIMLLAMAWGALLVYRDFTAAR
ncbi:MAG TPA: TFIIB-type zinc ribbon-containing protein [Chromatiaceae bacterium]|jgi:hypothetical protein|nr:MAG: hypothetical protein N838_23575 [Thiohalocapsa sp. PB-PSB1]QQO53323.1 MAG: TFIIB-type zinc ribbon-containing protein [Thiohalocapsa sp. PB-PSB1]HBG96161.1 TFIIB-type zinc ribbon-containing protein [Chromatiaceae bacterium]HCS89486.1 TFIIB-type zinc ribbon-containing protein [Chromatiaceae bacterium]